MIKFYYGLRNF